MRDEKISARLPKVLEIIGGNLKEKRVSYALIGALALGIYGLPRYTADIDLLIDESCWPAVSDIMKRLGYFCYQKSSGFAQFDSESGILGSVDFLFVTGLEGREILRRSILINDDLMGSHPVIRPADFVILKLMAIANDPTRSRKDEEDILSVLKLYRDNLIDSDFGQLEMNNISSFAEKFGQTNLLDNCVNEVFGNAQTK